TSWFMATLFVCVVLFILGVWKQFNYLGISVATAALAFLVLCCSNVGGLATQGNIAMWKSGRLETLDVDSFYATGTASVPAAIKLYPTVEDKDLQYEIKYYISRVAGYNTENCYMEKSAQYFYNVKLAREFLEE
ncbi:MAG: DUF4173 domain-containing protein, partial [Oscillospiraceae bacterium]|nr:DUF4173 domain-containing protein [Oscillospiraceae bacterium]